MPDDQTASPDTGEPRFQQDCCIVGGGPAGMVLALLLVRQDVRVTVLEAHEDARLADTELEMTDAVRGIGVSKV